MNKELREELYSPRNVTRYKLETVLLATRIEECGISLQEISDILKRTLAKEEVEQLVRNLTLN